MKVLYVLAISVLIISCEGPVGPAGIQGENGANGINGVNGIDGQDGVTGSQGEPGAGTRRVISGTVTSDNMSIAFPQITTDIQTIPIIDVYVCPDGFACLAIPFTIDGVVASTIFLGPEAVSLINALTLIQVFASSGIYIIVIVE